MSLVGTLGRLAVGVLVAKGVGKVLGGRGGSGGGLGGLLGGALGGGSSGGGLGGLGSLLGGKEPAGGNAAPGGMTGGLGGLLESISGGAAGGASAAPSGGSLGDLLNSSLQGNKIPQPDAGKEEQARLLIKAMINAAKSDGNVDQAEQKKIVDNLGDDVSAEEREFVLGEMRAPLDTDAFIKSVPRGSEQQVYMVSLMGIDLDSKAEAEYLDSLRKGLGLSEQACNGIHEKVGAPVLYG